MEDWEFFRVLREWGIRRKDNVYGNLSAFLRLDEKYPRLILFKKLVRTFQCFQVSALFRAIGLKRIRLAPMEKYEESKQESYYSEDDYFHDRYE